MRLDTAFKPRSSSPAGVMRQEGRLTAKRRDAASPPGAGPVQLDFVHPLTKEVTTVRGPEGATIAELLAIAGVRHRRWGGGKCWIEDAERRREPVPVAREHFARVRPKAGTITTVMLWPSGGGGGGKDILRVILGIVVLIVAVVAASFVGPLVAPLVGEALSLVVGAVVATAITVVGNLLINALIPPSRPRTPEERLAGLAADRSAFYLQGASNRAKPYGVIPVHLGRLRRYADLAAEWFTEIVGNDQYLRGFLTWGLGRLKISDLKIGETPLSEYEGVEVRTVEGVAGDGPPQIYTDDAHTEGLSLQLTLAGGWQTRETIAGIDEFQVEIAFPAGLFLIANNDPHGTMIARTIEFDAEMAPTGTEDWTAIAWANATEFGFGTPGKIVITDKTRTGQPRRVGRAKPNPAGNPTKQWRVRLRRLNGPAGGHGSDDSYWAALKSIKHVLPLGPQLVGKLAYTELRIKATGQLNGTIQELNAIVESYVKPFDENGFTGAEIVSRNPAEHFAHVATHWSALRPIAAGRIDWFNLVEWRDACAAPAQDGEPKWMFDRVLESPSSLGRVLDEIAAAGRARRGLPGGKHGVIRDLPQTVPKQHFTPRSSWDYAIDIPFRRRLHAVRVRYNKGGLGQEAEIVVYDDGYSLDGSVPGTVAATEIETVEAIGYTREAQVWRDWRYWLAVQKLRPHSHELSADVEHLVAGGRGVLVRCTHEVPGFGLGSARIKTTSVDGGGEFTGVTIDAEVTMEAGKSYGVRFRNPAGSFYTTVATVPGVTKTLTFSVPQPASWDLRVGDLLGFGLADKESVELLLNGVSPGANLSARLFLVDAAPGVHTADTGPIPAFNPQITRPPPDARKPEVPAIRAIKSDESVLEQRVGGALVVRFVAEFNPPQGQPVPEYIQARWRRIDATPWTPGSLQPSAGLVYSGVGVVQGETYRIEFRHVAESGLASDWVGATHTIVGKTTRPPDVPTLAVAGDHVVWTYPNAPLDVLHGGGFTLRFHYGDDPALPDLWGSAAAAHEGLIADTRFPTSLLPPGTLTILAKAVDADGNESVAPAVLIKDIGGPPLANVVETYDFKAAGWPGAIAGGSIVAGEIVAQTGTLMWSGNPATPLWNASPATLLWATTYPELVFEAQLVPPPAVAPARLTFAHLHEGVPLAIFYRRNKTPLWPGSAGGNPAAPIWSAAPSTTPLWSPPGYGAWPGALDLEDEHPIDIRLAAGGGPSQGKFKALVAEFDVPDLDEGFEDLALAAGGTRLPIANDYRTIKTVIATLQDDGGAARTVKVIDKDPDLGPLLRAFDATGAGTTATIDARVQGY